MAITAGAHTRCVLLRRHTLQFLLAVLLFIFFFSIFFSVASYIFFLWLFLFIAVIIISFVLLPLHSFKRFNVNLLNQNVFTISLFYFISIESQHLCAFCWCCWCCCCHSSSSSSSFFSVLFCFRWGLVNALHIFTLLGILYDVIILLLPVLSMHYAWILIRLLSSSYSEVWCWAQEKSTKSNHFLREHFVRFFFHLLLLSNISLCIQKYLYIDIY